MANFEAISHRLEGIVNSQLNAARQDQGVWEWYNSLKRILSANYVTGTPTIYGPVAAGDTDFVAVNADTDSVLYGVLVDNSNASEAVWVSILDGGTGLTPGTEHIVGGLYFVPAATMRTWVMPQGTPYSATGIAIYAGTGTSAGLEAGTGVTGTNPTVVLVYTA